MAVNKYVVALSLDKVQSFLFEAVKSHVQDRQTESATLQSIKKCSVDVSVGFHAAVEDRFKNLIGNVLLSCSGVIIFESIAFEAAIACCCKSLFRKYYIESEGQKFLKYVWFEKEENEEIKNIKKAKSELKKQDCTKTIIENNKELLFSFANAEDTNNPLETKKEAAFVNTINDLYNAEEQTKYGNNHFRIAVIKADLDGLGSMFEHVSDYGRYNEISQVLNTCISLEGLNKAAKAIQTSPWVFPFYVAGDDIFFAVSIRNLLLGVRLCQDMLADINESLELKGTDRLTMSIGVETIFNKEPIRYYLERVEIQLKCAKKTDCAEPLKKFLRTRISLNGLVFIDVYYAEFKKEKSSCDIKEKSPLNQAINSVPIWEFFLTDIGLLERAKRLEIGSASFFYSLLEKLSDEAVKKEERLYLNNVLYHLSPHYLENPDETLRELELLLNTAIIRNLYKYKIGSKDEKGYKLCITDETKHRFETYLRLMLLFSDERFCIAGTNSDERRINKARAKDIRKFLFSKPLDYLFDLCNEKELLGTLIQKGKYEIKRGSYYYYYRHVKIEKTMFFRLRRALADQAANMIEANSLKEQQVNTINAIRKSDSKVESHLYFNKARFLEQTKKSQWTSDFVDSVMLIFSYNQMTINFKGLKLGESKNGKQDKSRN